MTKVISELGLVCPKCSVPMDDDWEVLLREWLNSIVKSGPVAQVKWIEDIAKIGREKQKQFLKYFTHLLQQAIRLRVSGDTRSAEAAALMDNVRHA